eukprot:1281835-Karenia_brevis.AAC.1
MIGWTCTNPNFSTRIRETLSNNQPSITSFASAMCESAMQHGCTPSRRRKRLNDDHPLVVHQRSVEAQRRGTRDALLRLELSKAVCKVRRQIRRIEANMQLQSAANDINRKLPKKRSSTPAFLTDSSGNQVMDLAENSALLTSFYEELFDGSDDVLPSWFDEEFDPSSGEVPWISMVELDAAIEALANNKTCSEDG